jgi:hypothetical protein
MREIENTINIPGYGRVYYIAQYSEIVPAEAIYVDHLVASYLPPALDDLTLVSATPLSGALEDKELRLDPIVSKECLEHAENYVITGEGL